MAAGDDRRQRLDAGALRDLDETWLWDGSNWILVHPDHSPPARHAAATNEPTATLMGTLSSAGDGYIVTLSFHRTDAIDEVLNWTVPAILTLSP